MDFELNHFQVLGAQSSGKDVKSLRDSEATITRTYREDHQEVRDLVFIITIIITGSDITARHSRYVNVGLFYLRQLFFAKFDLKVHIDQGTSLSRQLNGGLLISVLF